MRNLVGAICALVIGVGLAAPLQASASEVFSNGAAIPGSGGSDIWQYKAADDFVLANDAFISGGTITFGGYANRPTPDQVRYYFYANAQIGGSDGPGDELASGHLTITSIEQINNPGLSGHTLGTFTLENLFGAQAGTHYWFALRSFGDESFSWVASNFQSPTRTWEQSRFDNPPYWRSVDYERAFTLSAEVPEPATWAMLIMGFVGAGSLLRRHRSAIAS